MSTPPRSRNVSAMRKMENELIARGPKNSRKRAPPKFNYSDENMNLMETKELLTSASNRRARTPRVVANRGAYNWNSARNFIGKATGPHWAELAKKGIGSSLSHKGGKRSTHVRSTHVRSTHRRKRRV